MSTRTVRLTDDGVDAVDGVMPAFNVEEAKVTGGLTTTETNDLARLLRAVLRTTSELDGR